MAKRIELSFSADLPGPSHQDAYGSSGADIQDTVVLQADSDISEADRGENVARLEELRVIGQHTVATLVKGLEKSLGQELYPSKIVQEGIVIFPLSPLFQFLNPYLFLLRYFQEFYNLTYAVVFRCRHDENFLGGRSRAAPAS